MINITTGSTISPPTQRGSLEARVMVRSPTGLRSRSQAHSIKPAAPSGADIAAALFARPSVVSDKDIAAPAADDAVVPLTITRQAAACRTTLHFAGMMNASTVHQLRDAAFTEIGLRPKMLCLDLTEAGLPDALATDALVTIGNVARMMGVSYCVRVSPSLGRLLEETTLSRLVPLDRENPESDGS